LTITHREQLQKAKENDRRRIRKTYNADRHQELEERERQRLSEIVQRTQNPPVTSEAQELNRLRGHQQQSFRDYHGQRRAAVINGQRTQRPVEGLQEEVPNTLTSTRQGLTQQRLSQMEHLHNPDREVTGNPEVRTEEAGYGIETGQPSAKIPNDRGQSGSSQVYRVATGRLNLSLKKLKK